MFQEETWTDALEIPKPVKTLSYPERGHGNFWSVSTIKEDFHNMFQGAPAFPGIVCDHARLFTGWVRDVLLPSAPSPLFADVHEMDRFQLKIMQKCP